MEVINALINRQMSKALMPALETVLANDHTTDGIFFSMSFFRQCINTAFGMVKLRIESDVMVL